MFLRVLFIASLIVLLQNISFSVFAVSTLDNIIVTGSHTPITVDEIGSSYTLITKEDIEKRQIVLVSDILRDVPGFAVSRSGGIGAQTQIRVRGAEANHLLVLIDGIEANDVTSGEFDFAHLMTDGIERIEIIRGPQSALYGSDALAGIVNIITKKSNALTSIASYAEVGSFDTFRSGASLSSGDDNYHYRLQASYLNSDGHNIAMQGNENDGYENNTISFRVGVVTPDNVKFEFTARHTESNSEIDEFDRLKVIDEDRESDVTQDYLQGHISYSSYQDRWQHLLGIAFSKTENDNFSNGVEGDGNLGEKLKFNYQVDLHLDRVNIVNSSHIITFAAEYERDTFVQQRVNDADQKWDLNTTGLVAGYRLGLWQQLFLSASIRHDNNPDFKNATSYRTTVAYKFPDYHLRLHTSYGTGIKNPTFAERVAIFPGFSFIGNPNLKPEQAKTWDIGIEHAFQNNKSNIGLTYFRSRLNNEINGFIFLPGSGNFTAMNIAGVSKRQGIEITANTDLTDAIKLATAYTWLESEQPDGTMEVRRPEDSAYLNLTYTYPNRRAEINLNISYTGEQTDALVTLGGYTLVNIATTYHITDKISLNGRVENLFDKYYQDVLSYQTPGMNSTIGFKIRF